MSHTKNKPVAWMTFGDIVEFETAESFLTVPREDRPNYMPLDTAPPDTLLDEVLGALRIGESDADLCCEEFVGIERKANILENRLFKIRAAIAILKGMK